MSTYFFVVMPGFNQCLLKCLPGSLLLDVGKQYFIPFSVLLVQKSSEIKSPILATDS